jgi:metal-responsive CopG/Arc/MetJ family transcriptional regulator
MTPQKQDREMWSLSVPEDLAGHVDGRLGAGDSRSEWIRTAIQMRLAIEDCQDD